MSSGLRIANAPVSFGVFELSGDAQDLPAPDDLAAAVASSGYTGIDLGPPGYLGRGMELTERLNRHGLALAGGWVALRFSEPEGFEKDLVILDQALDLFTGGREAAPASPPKPTLADAGSPARAANPGRGKDLAEIRLDDNGWKRLAEGVELAAARCRERGFEATFHHHACTHVEAPQEIERLLELTTVGLCLDSGHLLLGGGDPVAALGDWGERVNHIHVKDARLTVLDEVVAQGAGMEAVWRRGAFCALGEGDVDVDGFIAGVKGIGYEGWLVVEQDRLPDPNRPDSMAAIAREQEHNRAFLERHGL